MFPCLQVADVDHLEHCVRTQVVNTSCFPLKKHNLAESLVSLLGQTRQNKRFTAEEGVCWDKKEIELGMTSIERSWSCR